jgi:AcrR family transcriptional regulator
VPKVSAEHLAARRSGILKAALRCFSRNGLHATSMKDICRAANLSPGAVYRYFESKEQIVEALADMAGERIHNFLEASGDDEITVDSLADRLEALVRTLERSENVETMRLDIVLWGEALRLPEVKRVYLDGAARLRRSIAELAAAAQAQGDLAPEIDPRAVARSFVALFEGLALQKILEPDLDIEPALAATRALFKGLEP